MTDVENRSIITYEDRWKLETERRTKHPYHGTPAYRYEWRCAICDKPDKVYRCPSYTWHMKFRYEQVIRSYPKGKETP